MKHSFAAVLIALMALTCVPVLAQSSGTVRGVCKDTDGNVIAGATVEWVNMDNGRKYDLKTNNKGEYFSLGIASGKYKVSLLKDGKELFHLNGVNVETDEVVQDFDLKKEMSAAAQQQGMSAEQLKVQQEQQAKQQKEVNTVKSLNEKLASAKQSADAGDFDAAVTQMTEASQIDPNRDLIWAKLGEYETGSANKQTDSAEKAKRYAAAVDDYQKAIDLKQKAADAAPQKAPDASKVLAQYYNNMGQADSKAGKTDDAVKAYTQAAQLDPANAAQYYFNLGAIMTNTNKVDDAIAAFDKAIAADPNKADAYYWKGVNLISKASTDKDGKVIPAPGTEEALNKYLELQPTGPYADGAKALLQSLGSQVETSYGKQKKAPPKKQQ